jgi:hypothetical protein
MVLDMAGSRLVNIRINSTFFSDRVTAWPQLFILLAGLGGYQPTLAAPRFPVDDGGQRQKIGGGKVEPRWRFR